MYMYMYMYIYVYIHMLFSFFLFLTRDDAHESQSPTNLYIYTYRHAPKHEERSKNHAPSLLQSQTGRGGYETDPKSDSHTRRVQPFCSNGCGSIRAPLKGGLLGCSVRAPALLRLPLLRGAYTHIE